MRNITDCMVVLRSYYVPCDGKARANAEARIKEFIFRDAASCRRYCVCFERKGPRISNVTEHGLDFFDSIARAGGGKNLYMAYRSEGIDPAPLLKDLSDDAKYSNLKEFCVIYNITYNEHSLINAMKGAACPISYHDNSMVVDSSGSDDNWMEDDDDD